MELTTGDGPTKGQTMNPDDPTLLTPEQRIARHLTANWYRLQHSGNSPTEAQPTIANVAHEIATDLFGAPQRPPVITVNVNGTVTADDAQAVVDAIRKWNRKGDDQ